MTPIQSVAYLKMPRHRWKKVAKYTCGYACFALLWSVITLTRAQPVRADAPVAILGLRSIEGDDDFAKTLTASLRKAARRVPGWSILDRDVSLAQMSLVHGCDDPDTKCLGAISKTLEAQYVLFGTLARVSENPVTIRATLFLYNRDAGKIERSLSDTLPLRADSAERDRVAQRFIKHLAGARLLASLSIQSNVPGTAVMLDGQELGITDDQGEFSIQGIRAGSHVLELSAPGYSPYRQSITFQPGAETSLPIQLSEAHEQPLHQASSGSSIAWLGWASLGASAILLGLTGYSWIRLQSIEESGSYTSYREAAGSMISDVCKAADQDMLFGSGADAEKRLDKVQSLCSEASTLEILQYVFLGGAVVTAGVGVAILLTQGKSDTGRSSSVSFAPHLSPRNTGFSLNVNF